MQNINPLKVIARMVLVLALILQPISSLAESVKIILPSIPVTTTEPIDGGVVTYKTLPTPKVMLQYRSIITREARYVFGINAPVAMLAGQIWQESSGKSNITASDGGMGLTQFMQGTVVEVVKKYPELGPASPYNPTWAIRAQTRYLSSMYKNIKGKNDCERFSATLKAYNAGPGYVSRSQKISPNPSIWYGVTEDINKGQSLKNFIYSRWYPRIIIFTHQRRFVYWGGLLCDLSNVPPENPNYVRK